MYHFSPCVLTLPNKRVQSDAAAGAGYRGENYNLSQKSLLL